MSLKHYPVPVERSLGLLKLHIACKHAGRTLVQREYSPSTDVLTARKHLLRVGDVRCAGSSKVTKAGGSQSFGLA
jgi:hypothetical protein